MPEEFFSEAAPAPEPSAHAPPAPAAALAYPAPAPRRGGGTILLALITAFLLGAAGVAYAVWEGLLPFPRHAAAVPAAQSGAAPALASPGAAAGLPSRTASASTDPAGVAGQQDQLEARVAALSARLDALTIQAQAASGNAGRSEALLVAFAARRMLDRGDPLGVLEDQLRLRFGDSQPHAVTTVIEAARQPVTLDQLVAGLDSLAPSLTETPMETSAWARISKELGSLFVIRREASPSPAPQAMLGHARILLESGRTEDAIGEVEHLPGASGASDWFTAARRYDNARRALDVLETAAMLGTPGTRPAAGQIATPPSPPPAL